MLEARAENRATADLGPDQRQSMLDLLRSSFTGVDPAAFLEDLLEKQGAILLKDAQGNLLGFSTWTFYDASAEGLDLRVAYFGDTIVRREAWSSPALPRAVIRLLMAEARRTSPRPLVTLLLCAGHRTYHFLPFLCLDYFPRPQGTERLRRLRNALGRGRFGAQFDPASGVAVLERGAYALAEGVEESERRSSKDPIAAYFQRANPGWSKGHELVCVAEMAEGNLTAAARRLCGGRT
jgi:hypothetical protein